MKSLIVVDSGTSTTRARLFANGRVTRTVTAPVGARDTAIEGSNARLKDAFADLLSRLGEERLGQIAEAVICSGMITSNMGLLEVPHLAAPATPDALAKGMVRQEFPGVTKLQVHFVPGVRTLSTSLIGSDLLRGEEVECLGLRSLLQLSGSIVFMHYGSHSKAIETDATGTILCSRTALTGELLSAITQHTILANTVALDEIEVDYDSWQEGLQCALQEGLGRALFLIRIDEQIGERNKSARTNFLLGALATLDLPLLRGAIRTNSTIVLYGRGTQKCLLGTYLRRQTSCQILLADDAQADLSAVLGAVMLYKRHRQVAYETGEAS
jgi:2-dehydro-3-deoxygalactonokinase